MPRVDHERGEDQEGVRALSCHTYKSDRQIEMRMATTPGPYRFSINRVFMAYSIPDHVPAIAISASETGSGRNTRYAPGMVAGRYRSVLPGRFRTKETS